MDYKNDIQYVIQIQSIYYAMWRKLFQMTCDNNKSECFSSSSSLCITSEHVECYIPNLVHTFLFLASRSSFIVVFLCYLAEICMTSLSLSSSTYLAINKTSYYYILQFICPISFSHLASDFINRLTTAPVPELSCMLISHVGNTDDFRAPL